MKTTEEHLQTFGVIPVVVLNDEENALPLAKALVEGGLPCAEVTFRTEAAEESIRRISEKYPEMLVGAGTVLTTEQAD
ncbi:MAG: 2-dehydro-3-deoxyphosphogluconate aldolase, partial [Lachnospiraceae bacterium]|nr:2-dehydro-3-deoxyphosphogluconate aldolase [Lachnospiraceae bacterium]